MKLIIRVLCVLSLLITLSAMLYAQWHKQVDVAGMMAILFVLAVLLTLLAERNH